MQEKLILRLTFKPGLALSNNPAQYILKLTHISGLKTLNNLVKVA